MLHPGRNFLAGVFLVAIVAVMAGSSSAQAAGPWTAQYFNNKTLGGKPVVTQNEAQINYNWFKGSPLAGVNANGFSVRWTGTFTFAAGTYEFRTGSDDGIRVWLDKTQIINQWNDHPYQTYFTNVNVKAGNHTIRVEYFEDKGFAAVKMVWAPIKSNPWEAQYFNGTNLSGKVVLDRPENNINNWWRRASPGPNVRAMNFSVTWTRTVNFTAGTHKFLVTVSDGAQLYIDGDLEIDAWYDHGVQTHTAKVNLSAGNHDLELDFYNHSDPAVIVLTWN